MIKEAFEKEKNQSQNFPEKIFIGNKDIKKYKKHCRTL